MSRTDAVLEAMRQEIERHRAVLDKDDDLRTVSLVVKLRAGSWKPRAVLFSVESEKGTSEP